MLACTIQTADNKCLGNIRHVSNLALQHLIQHHLVSELAGCFWGLRRLSLVDLDGIFCSETSMCLLGPRSGCMCSTVILAFPSLGCSCIRVAGTLFSTCIPLHTSTLQTVISSPHKMYGPETNDMVLQLRKRGISKVILAGMSANLCVEAHLRELLEQGFEVAVVKDATAGAQVPEGDGYQAALVNFRYLANAVVTTSPATNAMKKQTTLK